MRNASFVWRETSLEHIDRNISFQIQHSKQLRSKRDRRVDSMPRLSLFPMRSQQEQGTGLIFATQVYKRLYISEKSQRVRYVLIFSESVAILNISDGAYGLNHLYVSPYSC